MKTNKKYNISVKDVQMIAKWDGSTEQFVTASGERYFITEVDFYTEF